MKTSNGYLQLEEVQHISASTNSWTFHLWQLNSHNQRRISKQKKKEEGLVVYKGGYWLLLCFLALVWWTRRQEIQRTEIKPARKIFQKNESEVKDFFRWTEAESEVREHPSSRKDMALDHCTKYIKNIEEMLHSQIQNSATLLRETALNSAVRSKVEVKKIKLQNILMDTKLRG